MSTLVVKYETDNERTTQIIPIYGDFTYVELKTEDSRKEAFLANFGQDELPENFDVKSAPYAYVLADFGEGKLKRYLLPGMFAYILNENAKRVHPV